MKKLILTCALAVSALTPAIASAADPAPADFKNAAKYCKALKAASGSNFASMFGTKKNAYGKCVSSTAKQRAENDETQTKTAKTNAAQECKAEKTKGSKNAFGKCVSEKAKAMKDAADAEDDAKQGDRVNAAKTCKQAKKDDAEQFEKDYGSRRNAFGKCVSKTAKELAAARKDS